MEVKIQAIHFDATEKLQEFIEKKVAKFGKFSEEIRKVEVSLKVVKPETSMNKEASIKVLASTGEFFAEKVCDTFEEAVKYFYEENLETYLSATREQIEFRELLYFCFIGRTQTN